MSASSPDLVERVESYAPSVLRPAGVIAGKSPTQIAFGRLRRDPIAVICLVIVVLFALVAIGAPLWCDLLGVSTDTVQASTRVDLVTGLPKIGPPNHGFTMSHPFG